MSKWHEVHIVLLNVLIELVLCGENTGALKDLFQLSL